MHFRIHRLQKARIILFGAVIFLSAQLSQAQSSYTEAYKGTSLPAADENISQKNEESSVTLFERRILEFRYQGESFNEYEVQHKKVKIFDSEAQKDYSEIYIPLSNVEEVLFIKAKATTANGSVTETDISKIKSVEEDGKEYKLLVIEGVQLNGTVEYSYGLRKSPSIYRSYYLGSANRILQSEYWIISPQNLYMEHKVFNTEQFSKKDTLINFKDIESDAVIFNFKNIPPTFFLGRTFPFTPFKYRVESTLRRNKNRSAGINYEYNDIARVTYDLVRNQKEEGAKDIKKLASKIKVENLTTEREKIIEIESYVKKNFSKLKEKNEAANSIKFLIANKVGADNTIIALYSGLFEFFGIKYELGFIYDRTIKFIEEDFENWANVDQWVIRFPNSDTYILPLDFYSPPGYLNNDYRGTNMIRVKVLKVGETTSAVADLVKIPEGPLSHQTENIKIKLTDDFEASSKYEYTLRGNSSAGLKWLWDLTFEEPTLILKLIKNLVESRYPDMKTENLTFKFDDNYGKNDFALKVSFSSKPEELLEKAGDNYVFYPGRYYHSNFIIAEIPKDYAYPIQAKENTLTEFNMEIPVPEGYKVEIPKEAVFSSKIDFGKGRTLSLDVACNVEAEKVNVVIKENQQLGKIQPEDLPKLNEFIASLQKIEKIYLVINKK